MQVQVLRQCTRCEEETLKRSSPRMGVPFRKLLCCACSRSEMELLWLHEAADEAGALTYFGHEHASGVVEKIAGGNVAQYSRTMPSWSFEAQWSSM
eukprot:4236873-Amphidinium_carterae.1